MARTEAGEELVVTNKQAQAFDVFERRPIEIAPHDRLLTAPSTAVASKG